jgi:hypothetical protein
LALSGAKANSKIPKYQSIYFLVMNLQDVFKKIELALTPEKVELASMTLADGTMVEAEVFEAGANALLVDGEGNRVAVPIGEHKLEDGKILVVEEEGIIKEIKEAMMEEEPAIEVEIEAAAEEAAPEMSIGDLVAMVNSLREEVEMMKQEMGKKQEMAEEVVEEPVAEVAMAAQKPFVAAPVEKKHELKFHIGAERVATTKDRVFSKLFNN